MARKRRGRAEGSVFERADGQWCGSVSLGFTSTGKRNRRTVYAATKNEVIEKLRRLQADADSGRLVETERLTVGEYLSRWLHNTARNKVRGSTWERYRQLVELHLVPAIGGVKLARLAPLHVEQCYAELGRDRGEQKAASAWTRKMAGAVLSNALRHAVRMKLIPHNPASDVAKARPAEKEIRPLTDRQSRRLLASARMHPLYALFALALGSGMRQGELFALQWGDVDFEKGLLEVRRSLSWSKSEPVLKEPKSKAGRRTIVLPGFALAALQERRAAALKVGLITAPVFCTRTGRFISKSSFLRQVFRPLVKRVNATGDAESDPIPSDLRFHDLRHSHASSLVAAGHSIKAVSRRLGHASSEITLRVYAHLMPNDDAKLAEGVNALYG